LALLLDAFRSRQSIFVKVSKGLRSLVLLNDLSATPNETGSSGGDKTALLSSGSVSSHCRWVTNMLMVTSTVWMLNWVHGNTSHSWPVLSLSSGLEPGVGCLEKWLVSSLSSGDDSNHGSASTLDCLSGS